MYGNSVVMVGNNLSKQIIITTHSWEILNTYCSDIGEGTDRGTQHIKANPSDFKLIVFTENLGERKIQEYNLQNKKYSDVRTYFKQLWGIIFLYILKGI